MIFATRGEMLRAVLESIAFSQKQLVKVFFLEILRYHKRYLSIMMTIIGGCIPG